MEYELIYYDSAVHHINHYIMKTPPRKYEVYTKEIKKIQMMTLWFNLTMFMENMKSLDKKEITEKLKT